MKFSPLIIEDLSESADHPRFRLVQDLTYGPYRVPTDFITDLASIPQVLWNILPPVGSYDKAAVVHDWLYRNNGITRSEADQVLNQGMIDLGVREWKRKIIYSGVRLGGWKPWNNYRNGQHETR
jgi:hypothetical protein